MPLMDIANPLNSFTNSASNLFKIYSGFVQQAMDRRKLNEAAGAANEARGSTQLQQDLLLSIFPRLRDSLLGQQDVGSGVALGDENNPGILFQVLNSLQSQPELINRMFSGLSTNDSQNRFIDPLLNWAGNAQGQGEALQGNYGTAQSSNNDLSSFFSNFLNGGMSTSGRNAGEELLQNGGKTEGTNYLSDRLKELIGSGGKGADLTSIMQVLSSGLATGGQTDELNSALTSALGLINNSNKNNQLGTDVASNILQNGGVTANSQTGQNTALSMLNGGMSPESARMFEMGSGKMVSPLISTNDSIGLLSGVMGSQAVKNGMTANAQALMRGGGQGITSGTQEMVRRDASDKGLETLGNTLSQHLLSQQSLGLQENQIGAGLMNSAQDANTSAKNTGASLLSSLQGNDTSRFGAGSSLLTSMLGNDLQRSQTGFSGLGTAQGLTNDRLNTFVNGALQGSGQGQNTLTNSLSQFGQNNAQTTQNMSAGSDMIGNYFRDLFGAASGQNQTINNGINLGNSGLDWSKLASGNMQAGLNGNNSSLQLNQSTIMDYLNTLRNTTSDMTGIGNTFLNYGQNGTNALGQLTGQTLSGFNNSMGNFLQLFGGLRG